MSEEENNEETALVIYNDPLDGIKEILAKGLPENVDLTSLFRTDEGKRFAEQVKSQSDFTLVGILFPLLIELFGTIFPKLVNLFKDEDFKKFYEEKISEVDELDQSARKVFDGIPDMLSSLFNNLDELEASEFETDLRNVFGNKAEERFIGNMVFSLYSYLQAYIDSIIELLIRTESVRKQFLSYWDARRLQPRVGLLELDELSGDKYDAISELVKRSLPLNLAKRMNIISTAMNCQSQIENHLRDLDAKSTVDELRFLCDKRNEIAHGSPAPDISEYGIRIEKFDWKGFKESLIEELEKIWPSPTENAYAIIEFICEWAESVSFTDYFALLEFLPKSAFLFPAIFDYVMYDSINNSNNQTG